NSIAGATNSTFTIASAQVADDGPYSVLVTNVFGAAPIPTASLTVVPALAWGDNSFGQIETPINLTNVMVVSAGAWHNLALQTNGTLVAWGDNSLAQTNLPPGLTNVVAIAAGGNHTLALKADGRVVAWGENTDSEGNFVGQSVVPAPATNVVAIAAGQYHSLV